MHLFSLFFVFLSIAYGVNCRRKPPSCAGSFVDRYCALDNKRGVVECGENLGFDTDIRIVDFCFDAMVRDGYKLSSEEKQKKLCNNNLRQYEYAAVSDCHTTAVNLDLKRGGKRYYALEYCLSKIEKEENKQCENSDFKPPTSDKPDKSKIINVKAENNSGKRNPWNSDQGSINPWNSNQGSKNPWNSNQGSKNPWYSNQGSKNPWNTDQGGKNPWNSDQGSNNPWNSDPWTKEISFPSW